MKTPPTKLEIAPVFEQTLLFILLLFAVGSGIVLAQGIVSALGIDPLSPWVILNLSLITLVPILLIFPLYFAIFYDVKSLLFLSISFMLGIYLLPWIDVLRRTGFQGDLTTSGLVLIPVLPCPPIIFLTTSALVFAIKWPNAPKFFKTFTYFTELVFGILFVAWLIMAVFFIIVIVDNS